MLGGDGVGRTGAYLLTPKGWEIYQPTSIVTPIDNSRFITPLLPVDFHRHAVAGIDLSNFEEFDLQAINLALQAECLAGVLTFFLTRSDLAKFYELACAFSEQERRDKYPYIFGLAVEGPLLASPGGTPHSCVWNPTRREWQTLARCGELGLKYVVVSPDVTIDTAASVSQGNSANLTMDGVFELLLEAGISPALGHFRKTDPEASAQKIQHVFDIAAKHAGNSRCPPLLSDHLFNDMPLRIKHSWRTADQKAHRQVELETMHIGEWQIDNIRERIGPVPATLIRGAHDGLISLCINFDGEHVDLAIALEVVRIAGADHIIALTDRVDGTMLARQKLFRSGDNRLLYDRDGIVVAGSTTLDQQIANMRGIGICEEEIWKMVSINPCRALGVPPETDGLGRPSVGSLVDDGGRRDIFDLRPTSSLAKSRKGMA
jgi:N-acetylglucosamine-6-phosphate deacetylase